MSGHEGLVQFVEANWLWIIIWCWILGVFGAIGETSRRISKRRRKAAEVRHRRKVELELARAGVTARRGRQAKAAAFPAEDATALPAAVIPSPPGARPVQGAPGACRHERIVPAITDDGEIARWLCANPRCDAEFPPGTAIYEAPS